MEGQTPTLHQIATPNSPDQTPAYHFFGQRSWRPGYQSLEPPDATTEMVGIWCLLNEEKKQAKYSALITELLSTAGFHFRRLGSNRMCVRLSWETAEELSLSYEKNAANASTALSLLRNAAMEYRKDQWNELLHCTLLRQLACPRQLEDGAIDSDCRRELALICFELASLDGEKKKKCFETFVALTTGTAFCPESSALMSIPVANSWIAQPTNECLALDITQLNNRVGLIQTWSHFPVKVATFDEIPRIEMFIRLNYSPMENVKFMVTKCDVTVQFYHLKKDEKEKLIRVNSKASSFHIEDVKTQLKLQETLKLEFNEFKEEAMKAVIGATDDVVGSSNVEAYASITGWSAEIETFQSDHRGLLKLSHVQLENTKSKVPQWIKTGSNVISTHQTCVLKPRKPFATLEIDQSSWPALLGEEFPMNVIVENTSSGPSEEEEMFVTVDALLQNQKSECLKATSNDRQFVATLKVPIESVKSGEKKTIQICTVTLHCADVLNLHVVLHCGRLVEPIGTTCSLPVVDPISLVQYKFLDFDTLQQKMAYNPHNRCIISTKLLVTSPHDLELVSLKLGSVECAADNADSWPRPLRSGTTFVEAFDFPPNHGTIGDLSLAWRRKNGTGKATEQKISIEGFPTEKASLIVRPLNAPARAELFKPCEILYHVKNVSPTTLIIHASLQTMPNQQNQQNSMLISGPSEISLTLVSGESKSIPISFIPLVNGFSGLPRMRCVASSSETSQSGPTPQMNGEAIEVSTPMKTIFVQTSPSIEWVLPGIKNSAL